MSKSTDVSCCFRGSIPVISKPTAYLSEVLSPTSGSPMLPVGTGWIAVESKTCTGLLDPPVICLPYSSSLFMVTACDLDSSQVLLGGWRWDLHCGWHPALCKSAWSVAPHQIYCSPPLPSGTPAAAPWLSHGTGRAHSLSPCPKQSAQRCPHFHSWIRAVPAQHSLLADPGDPKPPVYSRQEHVHSMELAWSDG